MSYVDLGRATDDLHRQIVLNKRLRRELRWLAQIAWVSVQERRAIFDDAQQRPLPFAWWTGVPAGDGLGMPPAAGTVSADGEQG